MAKRKQSAMKLTRLEARTRVIQGVCRLAFLAFCLAIGFVVVATAVPQWRELDRVEAKLKQAELLEQRVKEDEDCQRIEYEALRQDPAFLDIHARDRLDYYREGERVLKIKEN